MRLENAHGIMLNYKKLDTNLYIESDIRLKKKKFTEKKLEGNLPKTCSVIASFGWRSYRCNFLSFSASHVF